MFHMVAEPQSKVRVGVSQHHRHGHGLRWLPKAMLGEQLGQSLESKLLGCVYRPGHASVTYWHALEIVVNYE
jgi:hypothetical protein